MQVFRLRRCIHIDHANLASGIASSCRAPVAAHLRFTALQLPPQEAVWRVRVHSALQRCAYVYPTHILALCVGVIVVAGTKANFCSIKCKSVQDETKLGGR